MTPVLSIIIPCYNHGRYIKEALESIALCTATSLYEVIIIDDASTDAYTIEILNDLEQDGYTIIRQPNQGLGAARNNGITMARGKYILPLDSDNRIRPDYIYESIKVLDSNSQVAVVYGNAEYFGEQEGVWTIGPFNLQRLMLGNYIDACAVFRKSVWEAVGGYDTKMPVMGAEDWDLWLRIARGAYGFHYIDKVLFDYRVVTGSMSRTNDAENSAIISTYVEEKYKDYLGKRYIEQALVKKLKENKKLFFKLVLRTLFPRLLFYLATKKKLANESIL